MLIGYARVSTEDQRLHLQLDALVKAGVDPECIYKEQAGGTKKRLQLEEALKVLRPGDTLIVWRLDRLGRSAEELLRLVREIEALGAKFKSLSESIDTSGPVGVLILQMFAAFAEFERNLIRERTKRGLDAARARGVKVGRDNKWTPELEKKAINAVLDEPTIKVGELCKRLGICKATFYKNAGGGVNVFIRKAMAAQRKRK